MLQGEGWKRIYECPVGKVLREAPHIFDVIERGSMTEAMTPDIFDRLPGYMQRAIRVVSSERARLQEMPMSEMKGRHDSAAGMAARRG
jgi:hypothetical protein